MLTALPDIRQTFHMNLAVTTIALVQIDPWVLYVLSYLVCCDFRIRVDCFVGSCVCPIVLCVPSSVGTNPFHPTTHLHPLPLVVKETLAQVYLHSPAMRTSLPKDKADHSPVLTSNILGKSLRQWKLGHHTDGTPTPNGVRSSWDFIPRLSPKCWWVQHHQHFWC